MRKRRADLSPAGGEDSFLDIISNMVGIMIILVMIAGTRVGVRIPDAVETVHEPSDTVSETVELNEPNETNETVETVAPPATLEANEALVTNEAEAVVDEEQARRYIETIETFEERKAQAAKLQSDVTRLNEQMLALKSQTDGADGEYRALLADLSAVEALIERLEREKSDAEKQRAEQAAEWSRLKNESERLRQTKASLAAVRPAPTVLENIPTPLAKKVEGKEAVFVLKGGKISHVPVGEFTERARGFLRSLRDMKNDRIDETLGPVDGYRFHFLGSLHEVREEDHVSMMVVFDRGEFLPVSDSLGEDTSAALADGSGFRQKLALYLKDSSTITLAVYPDSFAELRTMKKYLLQNGYVIALRPMPAGKNIVISPQGTESTTY